MSAVLNRTVAPLLSVWMVPVAPLGRCPPRCAVLRCRRRIVAAEEVNALCEMEHAGGGANTCSERYAGSGLSPEASVFANKVARGYAKIVDALRDRWKKTWRLTFAGQRALFRSPAADRPFRASGRSWRGRQP